MSKIVPSAEAVSLIPDEATIVVSGNSDYLLPDTLLSALEARFLETGHPRGLTLTYPVIPGAFRTGTGVDRLAHPGLLRRIIASSYYTLRVKKLMELVKRGNVEAHVIPMGTLYNLFRATAAGQPGFLTTVGVDTLVDPTISGQGLMPQSGTPLAQRIHIDGNTFLYYRSLPIDFALIRATHADVLGNLTFEDEPNTLGAAYLAAACKQSGGSVIAQVKRVGAAASLPAREVKVPGFLVDQIVLDPQQQCGGALPYDPAQTGDIRVPWHTVGKPELGLWQHIILTRAARELRAGMVANVGFGLAASLPRIALEEDRLSSIYFSVEHGPVGGMPLDKTAFGSAINPLALLDSPFVFDLYNGGLLDITFLGMAQVNASGSVNVSSVRGQINLGGFLDIVHRTPQIIFCGSFTAGGLAVDRDAEGIRVCQEGVHHRFVADLEHCTFDAHLALQRGQRVLYITERAVFGLTPSGLELQEIAPGIDLEKDVLAHMEFRPRISPQLRIMSTGD